MMTESLLRRRPEKAEYFDYYDTYVRLVPDGDIVALLREDLERMVDLLGDVDPETANFRYAPGKWTLKQVLGHVLDIEWVFTHRALTFARGQAGPLPGVDQEVLVEAARFPERELSAILSELRHLRSANTLLFESFDEVALGRRGTASGYEFTVRSILYIIAGHARHHTQVMKKRYLNR